MVDDFDSTGWQVRLHQEASAHDDAERRMERYHAHARAMVEEAATRVESE